MSFELLQAISRGGQAGVQIVLTGPPCKTLPVSHVSVMKETISPVVMLPFTEKGRGKVMIAENPKCQLVLYIKDVSYIKNENNFYCVPWKEKGKL